MNFYTYGHYTESGRLFYIGKGQKGRAHCKTSRNIHWKRTVAKHGLKVEIFAKWETEQEALDHECFLISCFRDDLGFKLCNFTDGGEGTSGFKASDETRSKLSILSKRNWEQPDYIEKMNSRPPGGFTEKKLQSSLTNASAAREALTVPEVKEVARIKNSVHSKTLWQSEGYKERLSDVHKSLWTEDRRAQIGAHISGRVRMTNGTLERNVLPADVENLLQLGWVRGRKPVDHSKRSNLTVI